MQTGEIQDYANFALSHCSLSQCGYVDPFVTKGIQDYFFQICRPTLFKSSEGIIKTRYGVHGKILNMQGLKNELMKDDVQLD